MWTCPCPFDAHHPCANFFLAQQLTNLRRFCSNTVRCAPRGSINRQACYADSKYSGHSRAGRTSVGQWAAENYRNEHDSEQESPFNRGNGQPGSGLRSNGSDGSVPIAINQAMELSRRALLGCSGLLALGGAGPSRAVITARQTYQRSKVIQTSRACHWIDIHPGAEQCVWRARGNKWR
jgi:hypothetical protein